LKGLGLIAVRHALERNQQAAPVWAGLGHDQNASPILPGQHP
jgi:hypothetical protein